MLWLLPAKNKKYDYDTFVPFGWLVTPYSGYWHIKDDERKFACDTGCYQRPFQSDKYLKMLDFVAQFKERCLFVNPPDVVGDCETTTLLYHEWRDAIKQRELPIAYIMQDGCNLLTVQCDAIFVGGSTEYKLSQTVIKILERFTGWRHIGRVNTLKRLMHFYRYADSFDGTQCYRFQPDITTKSMNNSIRFLNSQKVMELEL